MEKVRELIDSIICTIQDEEVSNKEEYIKMEVNANKDMILEEIIKEIKECL